MLFELIKLNPEDQAQLSLDERECFVVYNELLDYLNKLPYKSYDALKEGHTQSLEAFDHAKQGPSEDSKQRIRNATSSAKNAMRYQKSIHAIEAREKASRRLIDPKYQETLQTLVDGNNENSERRQKLLSLLNEFHQYARVAHLKADELSVAIRIVEDLIVEITNRIENQNIIKNEALRKACERVIQDLKGIIPDIKYAMQQFLKIAKENENRTPSPHNIVGHLSDSFGALGNSTAFLHTSKIVEINCDLLLDIQTKINQLANMELYKTTPNENTDTSIVIALPQLPYEARQGNNLNLLQRFFSRLMNSEKHQPNVKGYFKVYLEKHPIAQASPSSNDEKTASKEEEVGESITNFEVMVKNDGEKDNQPDHKAPASNEKGNENGNELFGSAVIIQPLGDNSLISNFVEVKNDGEKDNQSGHEATASNEKGNENGNGLFASAVIIQPKGTQAKKQDEQLKELSESPVIIERSPEDEKLFKWKEVIESYRKRLESEIKKEEAGGCAFFYNTTELKREKLRALTTLKNADNLEQLITRAKNEVEAKNSRVRQGLFSRTRYLIDSIIAGKSPDLFIPRELEESERNRINTAKYGRV